MFQHITLRAITIRRDYCVSQYLQNYYKNYCKTQILIYETLQCTS